MGKTAQEQFKTSLGSCNWFLKVAICCVETFRAFHPQEGEFHSMG